MYTIAIANQKGGVGKTTTTVNLAAGLVREGRKVLCLDFDPQCHLAKYLGYSPNKAPTITDFLFAKATYQEMPDAAECIRHSKCGLDFIPASLALSKAEGVLAQAMFREKILRDVLAQIVPTDTYDYLLIDCNPSMGILLTNVLVASNRVLIPVQTEDFAVDGLADMLELVQAVKVNINPSLDVLGFLATMTTHTKGSSEIVDWLHCEFPSQTFDAAIGRYADAPKSVKVHTPMVVGWRGKLAEQYTAATKELIRRMEGMDFTN